MNQTDSKFKFSELLDFIKSRIFRYTIIRIGILFVILWLLNSFFLNFYTNHGQKLTIAKYEGIEVNKAKKHALAKGFEIQITDSIHLVGKPGGIIISQVPKPKSIVKRGHKIYVTTTRYQADIIMSSNLPDLYGKKLEHKIPELNNSFDLRANIIGYEYDSGPEGHILKVYYKNQLVLDAKSKNANIALFKGDTLHFIVSNKNGGDVEIPDLKCKTLAEVKFILSASDIDVGQIEESGEITDINNAYVISQYPEYSNSSKMKMGSKMNLTLQQAKPENCE